MYSALNQSLSSSSSPANASSALEGKILEGQKKNKKWEVIEKVSRRPGSTGGTFSIGYIVVDESGNRAFMKATDIGLLTRDKTNFLENLGRATSEQGFERKILDICHGNNMDKIVRCLDYGEFSTVHNNIQDVVFFLIFEPAEGDIRTQISASKREDLVWMLHALHNLSTAIWQLHKADISHNDIKPSNILVFEEYLQKLSDMGRATSGKMSGPFDVFECPGQVTYAAPEQLYDFYQDTGFHDVPFNFRRASDMYLLGSMLYFFITGQMLTPSISTFLRIEHHPNHWKGTFEDVLPYWRDAYGGTIDIFTRNLEKNANEVLTDTSDKLLACFKQLAEPDPRLRGHPSNLNSKSDQYSFERFISLFNLLRTREQTRNKK